MQGVVAQLPGLVAQSCNPATREARTWDGLRLHSHTLTSPLEGGSTSTLFASMGG